MTASDLKLLLERAETWPEAAQAELVAVAKEIEQELSDHTYEATDEELRIIDEAVTSLDAGEAATEAEIEAAFARFRR
jgi:U3 small nucleolar RNA-associated protein 14